MGKKDSVQLSQFSSIRADAHLEHPYSQRQQNCNEVNVGARQSFHWLQLGCSLRKKRVRLREHLQGNTAVDIPAVRMDTTS